MDDQMSLRLRFARVASVRGALCGLGGLLAEIVVHPVATPSTAPAP
jgi:hypothetical protein